jgi:zinc protease
MAIGRVTPEQAKTVIEPYFGAWQAAGPKPDTLLPPVPFNKPSTTLVPNTSRIQDRVILAETLGLTRSNPDYYALQLGNHVLGGALYASRLYRDLREHTGLVYDVSSSFDVGKLAPFMPCSTPVIPPMYVGHAPSWSGICAPCR